MSHVSYVDVHNRSCCFFDLLVAGISIVIEGRVWVMSDDTAIHSGKVASQYHGTNFGLGWLWALTRREWCLKVFRVTALRT